MTLLPRADGSPEKARDQKLWLRTAKSAPVRSSSGEIARPSIVETPNALKNSPPTISTFVHCRAPSIAAANR